MCPGTIVVLTRKEYKQAFFISFVASCLETTRGDPTRELQVRVLGKSTYDYVIDYLSGKGLYPTKPLIRNLGDWFRYSWLWVANSEPVINWVGKRINELLDLGVPPDEITLTSKWVFDVKVKKGSRWVRVAHKDPVVSAGLPYWIGFYQVYAKNPVPYCCPANPPSSCTTGVPCGNNTLDNADFGIYFTGAINPPGNYQAGDGRMCCYSDHGYNLNQPGSSFGYGVDTSGTKNITTWEIVGQATVNISGPYIVLFLTSSQGTSGGIVGTYCESSCCSTGTCGAVATCGCPSGAYPLWDYELIYENLGSLNITANTVINATIQLIIALASPG